MSPLTGVNLIPPFTEAELMDIVSKKPRVVRIPVRSHEYKIQFDAGWTLKRHGILPLFCFDIPPGTRQWDKQLSLYVGEFKAECVYGVLNEPIAMKASPGYYRWNSARQAFNYAEKYIKKIHSMIGPTSVLSPAVANCFEDIELEFLEIIINESTADILNLHIYDCRPELIARRIPLLKKWKKRIWVSEIGTYGGAEAQEAFANTCIPEVTKQINIDEFIWYSYKQSGFSLRETNMWGEGNVF